MHQGPMHRDLLRARTAASPTCKSCDGGCKNQPYGGPALPCTFCGGPEEDTGHLRIMCERDEAVARLLCVKVEELTADLPLADKAMEFMSWKYHGCRWTDSLMRGVVPGETKRLFGAVRAALARGPAKAKPFLEDMMQTGEDGYARGFFFFEK